MPIMASATEGQTYAPAPEGVHQAVCVDVIDLGMMDVEWQGKKKQQHKINVVWQISELRDDGSRYRLFKRYTLSLSDKANLRKDLESWRGRAFTEDELRGFDVERLIGVNCLLNIVHRKSNDGTRTYANVVSIMPLVKGMPKLEALNYKRAEPTAAEQDHSDDPPHPPVTEELTEDDIPF
jgi:hypothetical protein